MQTILLNSRTPLILSDRTPTARIQLPQPFIPSEHSHPKMHTKSTDPLSHLFEKTRAVLDQGGFAGSVQALAAEQRRANVTTHSIAVIGEFKSGKSTFANAAFLRQPLLFADLMEATCVPTEITHGEMPRLLVMPFKHRQEIFDIDGTATGSVQVRAGEEAAFVIENPDRQEIRNETTADTPEERAFKARKISRVRLELPVETLRNVVVIDTPGINSTNTAVVETTYGVLPRCDAAILVIRSGQLTSSEEEFLRSKVFETGTTRLFMVINHFASQMPLSTEGKRKMVEALRAKLRNLGREYVPVSIVDANGWLEALQGSDPLPADVQAFQQQLERFIRLDLSTARNEKAVAILQREVRRALVETQAEIAMQDKGQEELTKLSEQVAHKESALLPKLEMAAEIFLDEVQDALSEFKQQTRAGLTKAANRFIDKLQTATDLSRAQSLIRDAEHLLQPEFEGAITDATRNLRQRMRQASQKYDKEARALLAKLDLGEFSLGMQEQPLLASLPSPIIALLDYWMVIMASPLPFFADILLRLMIDRFPELRRVMPAGILQNVLAKQFETGMRDQVAKALREMDERLEEALHMFQAEMRANVRKQAEGETAPLRAAMERVRQGVSTERRDELSRLQASLATLHSQLADYLPR